MRQASRILLFYQDRFYFIKIRCRWLVVVKKLKTRTINKKYKIMKEVDKGEGYASISKKYGITKQSLPGWLKEKTIFI